MKFSWGFIIVCLITVWGVSCKKKNTYVGEPPIILGHGGISLSPERAVYPPNSLTAIRYGMDVLNADGVEIDVQLTADSVLVLYHNDDLQSATNGVGCVGEYTYEDLEKLAYYQNDKIIRLETALAEVMQRKKYVNIDVKHYNFCTETFVDTGAINAAFKHVLSNYSTQEKERITVNARNFYVLQALTDSSIIKAYETKEIEKGIDYCLHYGIDRLTLHLSDLNEKAAELLTNNQVAYGIFGIKTKSEIAESGKYNSVEVISDNVAATKAYYQDY